MNNATVTEVTEVTEVTTVTEDATVSLPEERNYKKLNAIQRVNALSRIATQCSHHCRIDAMQVSMEATDKLVVQYAQTVKGMAMYDKASKKITRQADFVIGVTVKVCMTGNLLVTVKLGLANGKEPTDFQVAIMKMEQGTLEEEMQGVELGPYTRAKKTKED